MHTIFPRCKVVEHVDKCSLNCIYIFFLITPLQWLISVLLLIKAVYTAASISCIITGCCGNSLKAHKKDRKHRKQKISNVFSALHNYSDSNLIHLKLSIQSPVFNNMTRKFSSFNTIFLGKLPIQFISNFLINSEQSENELHQLYAWGFSSPSLCCCFDFNSLLMAK